MALATPPVGTSPTKRVHASPSPSPTSIAPSSPRRVCPKLADVEPIHFARELSAPDTPPSPDVCESQLDCSAVGTARVAQAQMKRLLELPLGESQMLAKLSSQSSMSEYNQLKLRSLQLPDRPLSAVPVPARPPPLQRSLSASTVQGSTSSLAIGNLGNAARVLQNRAENGWQLLRSTTSQAAADLLPRKYGPVVEPLLDSTAARSAPTQSRSPTPSTPPSRSPSQPGMARQDSSTSLTPTLVNFSLGSEIKPSTSGDLRLAISEAVASNLARIPLLQLPSSIGSTRPTPPVAPLETTGPLIAPVPYHLGTPMLPGMEIMNGIAVKTSSSHPMNISPILPPDCLSFIATLYSAPPMSPPPTANLSKPWVVAPTQRFSLYDYVMSPQAPPVTSGQRPGPPFGNLYLSSCPGKKVRLTGVQVKGGRSAICRDLASDFARAKEHNVSILICCLDDTELAFLGAPWEEYRQAAAALDLEIIRVPMAEGFAPPSIATFDELISSVVETMIRSPTSILVHCRGGVGRASVMALGILLKLGMFGSLVVKEGPDSEESRRVALLVLERSIETIRRRRSWKAIETPSQVFFLVEYIEYLQKMATPVHPSQLGSN